MVHGEQWPISLGKEAVEKASVVVVIALGRRGSSRYSVLGLKESQDYVLLTAAAAPLGAKAAPLLPLTPPKLHYGP